MQDSLLLIPCCTLHMQIPSHSEQTHTNQGTSPCGEDVSVSSLQKWLKGSMARSGSSLSQLVMEPIPEHRNSHAGNFSLGWTPPLLLSSEPWGEWPSHCGLCICLWTLKLWFWHSWLFQWHWTLSWTSPVLFPNHQLPLAYALKHGWERMGGRWVNLHLIHSTVTMGSRNRV